MKNFNKIEAYDLEYNELNDLIEEIYGKKFDFLGDRESGNDITHRFDVEKKELDEYEIEQLNDWKIRGTYNWVTDIVLMDMCNNDHIPPGIYLVNVCW